MRRLAHGGAQRVDVGDLALRVWGVDRVGAGTPAVVLVHGIGVSHRYLARTHNALRELIPAERAAVLTVDLPGYGGLPKPRTDADVPRIAAALGLALDRCGVDDAVLVGHSMGTQWVTELARQRPGLARGVVLIGPVADDRHRTAFAQARALAVDTLRESPGTNVVVFTDYLRCGVPWYLRQLRHMLAYPLEERARDLTQPLLVVRGDRDPIAGEEWCRRIAAAAPRGEFGVVAGGAHVIQDAQPRRLAATLVAHAAEVGLAAS